MNHRFAFAFVVLALAACSDESGPPRLDTGLPTDAPADELTPAEARAACEAYEDVVDATLGPDAQEDLACTLVGIVAALADAGTCSEATAQCIASGETMPTPVDFDCETATTFAPSGCMATIGELEACVNAYAAAVDAFKGRISCDLASDVEALTAVLADFETVFVPTTYPECASLSMECLELLGWTEAAAPPMPAM